MKGNDSMYINCRLKAINRKGFYKVELIDRETGRLLKTFTDRDLKGPVARAMSKLFDLFQVKVFWIQYYPHQFNAYNWILGDGCVAHTPAQLTSAGFTKYRQMVLRDFLRAQAFIEEA